MSSDPEPTRGAESTPMTPTILGRGSRLVGDAILSGSIRIDGDIEGKVEASERVDIGPDATVRGEIKARDVHISGTVVGAVVASGRIEIQKGAHVDGDISTTRLVMAEGAIFDGGCSMPTTSPAAADSRLRVIPPE